LEVSVGRMSAHVFWPPLAVLSMSVGVVMFIILKWGDRLCLARSTPLRQNYEMDEYCSDGVYSQEEDQTSYNELLVAEEGRAPVFEADAELVEMGEIKEAAV